MWVYTIIAICFLGYHLLKEALEPRRSADSYFDWDAYRADTGRIPVDEQTKKMVRGDYYRTKPKDE